MSNETHQAIAREAWTLVPRARHFNVMCGGKVIYEGCTSEFQGKFLCDQHNAAIERSHEPRHGIDLANIVRKRLDTLATDMIPLSTDCAEVLLAEAKAVESLISDLSPQRSHEPAKTSRIYTRCPACFNDTLTVNKGHLLCTWHKCPSPTLIDNQPSPASQPQRSEPRVKMHIGNAPESEELKMTLGEQPQTTDTTAQYSEDAIVDKLRTILPPATDDRWKHKLADFVNLILHGDDEHKAWLREAGEAFLFGKPIPVARGGAKKEPIVGLNHVTLRFPDCDGKPCKVIPTLSGNLQVGSAAAIVTSEEFEAIARLRSKVLKQRQPPATDDTQLPSRVSGRVLPKFHVTDDKRCICGHSLELHDRRLQAGECSWESCNCKEFQATDDKHVWGDDEHCERCGLHLTEVESRTICHPVDVRTVQQPPATDDKWFDERKEANAIAIYTQYDDIYDAAIVAFKKLRRSPKVAPATDVRNLGGTEGISEATSESAINAACFPATTENKTKQVQVLPSQLATDDRVKEQGSHAEWTHEKLQGLLRISNEERGVTDEGFEDTLDEINAALAAEREKVRKLHLPASSAALYDAFEEIKRIRQQLLQAEERLKQYESNKS